MSILALPMEAATTIAEELRTIGLAEALDGAYGREEDTPAHPSVALFCPRESGKVDHQPMHDAATSLTPTFTAAGVRYNWSELRNRYVAVQAGIPRFHGLRLVHNWSPGLDDADTAGSSTTVHSQAEDLIDITLGTGTTDNDAVRQRPNGALLTQDTGRRGFIASAYIKVVSVTGGPAAGCGAQLNFRIKRNAGTSSTQANSFTVPQDGRWHRHVTPIAVPDAGDTGIWFQLRTAGSVGTVRIQVRGAMIEEVTARNATAGTTIVPGEFPGYDTDGDGASGWAWYWKSIGNTRSGSKVTDGKPVTPVHPTTWVGDLRVFATYPFAARATAYSVGDRVRPDGLRPFNDGAGGSAYTQRSVYLECTTAGTTHATSTVNGNLWTITAADPVGQTITDGTVVWTVMGRYVRQGTPGAFCEATTTNALAASLESRNFSSGWFNNAGVMTISNAVGIDHSSRPISVQDDSTSNAEGPSSGNNTITANTSPICASCFIRKKSAGNYPIVKFDLGSDTVQHSTAVNTRTGAIADIGTAQGTAYIEDWGDWWRLAIVLTNTSQTTARLRMKAAETTDLISASGTVTGTTRFDFPMIEEVMDYPSSPVHNPSSKVTRPDDDLHYVAGFQTEKLDPAELFVRATVTALGGLNNSRFFATSGTQGLIQRATGSGALQVADGTNTKATSTQAIPARPRDLVNGQHHSHVVAIGFSSDESYMTPASSSDTAAQGSHGSFDGTAFNVAEDLAVAGNESNDNQDTSSVVAGLMFWPGSLQLASADVAARLFSLSAYHRVAR